MGNQIFEIDSSIIGTLTFSLMRACRQFQDFISDFFWFVSIKPVLFFARLVGRQRIDSNGTGEKKAVVITLDDFKHGHRILLSLLRRLFNISSHLNGVIPERVAYSKLLSWSKEIPIIAFQKQKTSLVFEILQDKNPNGSRKLDLMWVSTHEVEGSFRIISKETRSDQQNEIIIKCLWISGNEQGKIFEIDRNFPIGSYIRREHVPITAIYYPPRFLIVLMEAFISAGIILVFIQITHEGWAPLRELLVNMSRRVLEGWGLILYSLFI